MRKNDGRKLSHRMLEELRILSAMEFTQSEQLQ